MRKPGHQDVYVLRLRGEHHLELSERQRVTRLARANNRALQDLLKSGSPAAVAVRAEARDVSDKPSRKGAA